MRKLRRRIPNLTALTFFECAGRHMSFSRTAEELHVTQGAVSRQIKLLDESLGFALFTRPHRAVKLTPSGRLLHETATVALTQIATTIDEITDSVNPK